MRISRRTALVGVGALIAAGAAGVGALAWVPGGVKRRTLDIIAEVYGPEYANHSAATAFAEDYEAFVRAKGMQGIALNLIYQVKAERMPGANRADDRIRAAIVEKFATSTNIIRMAETGESLEFFGLFHPYDYTCANQLSRLAWDPEATPS